MALFQKINQDLTNNLKSRDMVAANALRYVKAQYPKYYKGSNRVLDDETIVKIIKNAVRDQQTTLLISRGLAKEGDDIKALISEHEDDLHDTFTDILLNYVPSEAPEEDVYDWIKANIDLNKYNPPMKAMGVIKQQFPLNDGSRIKTILEYIIEEYNAQDSEVTDEVLEILDEPNWAEEE